MCTSIFFISLQFRLYQTYLNNSPKQADSFDDFLKWSTVLLHDFNEIDRNLVNPKSIFTSLKHVKELDLFDLCDIVRLKLTTYHDYPINAHVMNDGSGHFFGCIQR